MLVIWETLILFFLKKGRAFSLVVCTSVHQRCETGFSIWKLYLTVRCEKWSCWANLWLWWSFSWILSQSLVDSITSVCCTLTSCLTQVHHPFALSPSFSCQNPHKHPRLLYLWCSTSSNSTHYSMLAGVTIAASSTPVAHISVNSYSGTQSLVLLLHQHPAYSCVVSHIWLYPSQTNTLSSLQSTSSTSPIWQHCSGDSLYPLAGSWYAEII